MIKTVLAEVEQTISKKFNKKVRILNTKGIGGGCISDASKLDTNIGAFFLKWNAHCATDMFEREAEGLQHLAKATDDHLQIPEVIGCKEVNETPGFLVLDYLTPGNSEKNTEEMLGRGLAQIHRNTTSQFGFYHDNYCGATPQSNAWNSEWITFFSEQRLGFLLQLIDKKYGLSLAEKSTYEKLRVRLPKLLPEESQPALIHGDLWSGNFMSTENGPALIDPAVYYADREMEFAIITLFGGFSYRFFEAYNEVYPLANDWRDRNSLYQLYHILNHYYLFGGGYGPQAFAVAKSYL
ncbi:fructosamine kinase family protein [Maribellus sp. YY47]|uniref:fructosamine kinase family protein n=1 Tax=Maribellus sp. YY47 TaxID=2929486 RepID=UPI0020008A8F|nr:fructosamine kinase family protein [Maribellus sp. YY47]MCK3685192.1 fructosamine kinase family protein [Maribellus sp. YY47]